VIAGPAAPRTFTAVDRDQHGDDTTVQEVLAKGKTDMVRTWVYVRDNPPLRRNGTTGGHILLLSRRNPKIG
jgi:hypothetical protein